MTLAPAHPRLQLPDTLHLQFRDFRRRVWTIRLIEAVAGAIFGLLVSFLFVFTLDRLWDTPAGVRAVAFVAVWLSCGLIPLCLHRWVWSFRHLEQLARLLSRAHPQIGDQLLGIIELVRSESEQARSLALCQAAVRQVAHAAQDRDFRDAVPRPRHRLWAGLAGGLLLVAVGLSFAVPGAAKNAWARLLWPWQDTPRFTFAKLEPLPDRIVVPHGEPFQVTVALTDDTQWRPSEGRVQFGRQTPVDAQEKDGRYVFELPPQIESGWLRLRIGDARQRVRIEPLLRPELTAVLAAVDLPKYLERPEPQRKDVRGGAISLVKGSRATFAATASRPLSSAQVDGVPRAPAGATINSPPIEVAASQKLEFRWLDEHGLAGKEPFTLAIHEREDESPSLACEDLPRQKVLLNTEQLTFKVRAQDDFGVKRVGLEWQGLENATVAKPARGERVLAAGGSDKEVLDLTGTFSAAALEIEPQPINVRVFVEDYYPGRPRVYSPTYTFYVLDAQQHAIWLTEQMSKWHRQALEVRDREMQLHETNKELRALSPAELDQAENRRRIENQAAAERANSRRLSSLVNAGEDLVRQAMRNPEIGVGHLEKWAEMLNILKDISGQRMPSVADLLKAAAQAPQVAANPSDSKAPAVGQTRTTGAAGTGEQKKTPPVPQVVDTESSHQPAGKQAPGEKTASSGAKPSLGLPQTAVAGGAKSNPSSPAGEQLDDAVREQKDLLAEFEKIAEELNRVLANLEGSTLVKRLKAASRMQYRIAGRINDQLNDTFGLLANLVPGAAQKVLGELAKEEARSSQDVSNIMDDMQGYFERRRFLRFKTVLDEMKKLDAVGSLRQIGDDLQKENGMSIAQCEYWSDTLDRWADDLVDPASSGKCPGGKSRSSLPPSVVLEVMQILEAEVNLREETRVAEQAKAAVPAADHTRWAHKLSQTQGTVQRRVVAVTGVIRDLPDGAEEFAPEIELLSLVAEVMQDAAQILATPETGAPAIAAETEAIELLLQSRRFNPRGGGGGGGSMPGGGGRGTTKDPALALLGSGVNEKEVREDHGVSQATGTSGAALPEEYRAGLDEYFNRLERK